MMASETVCFVDGFFDFSGDDDDIGELGSEHNQQVASSEKTRFDSAVTNQNLVNIFRNYESIPFEEELEWVSKFLDDSFPAIEEHKKQQEQVQKEQKTNLGSNQQKPVSVLETSIKRLIIPARARSKRTRPPSNSVSSLWSEVKRIRNKAEEPRKCGHCGVEKTPQWRTGPFGPKTLCNACGVRYKSGRLLPEYRPARSPSFSSDFHSNSHRKIVEMRRQKQQQNLSLKSLELV